MIPRRQRRSRLRSLTLLIASQLLLSGCGLVGLKKDVKLGVPYRAQDPNSLNCGPASVLMWRLFDGLPEISQASIGAWMGGSNCGYGEARIADGVRHFTNTTDAYVDYEGEINHEEFFSRQITSIDRRKPVIAIVNSFHAGVVNGGKWRTLPAGRYEWDYVYFHDPLTLANDYYASGEWLFASCPAGSETCTQIVSNSGTIGWQSNFAAFGTLVQLYGFYCPDGPDQPICP